MTFRIIAVGLTGLLLLTAGCAPDTGGLTRPPLNTIYHVAIVRYACGHGVEIHASYPHRDSAVVVYKNKDHRMTIARSADGARYTGNTLEWWTKGSGSGAPATLFVHRKDGQTGKAIAHCRQVSLAQ